MNLVVSVGRWRGFHARRGSHLSLGLLTIARLPRDLVEVLSERLHPPQPPTYRVKILGRTEVEETCPNEDEAIAVALDVSGQTTLPVAVLGGPADEVLHLVYYGELFSRGALIVA